jgi:polyhydroxybutyrate depolymerase
VLLMNGTADPLLPWDGGPMGVGRGERGSVLSAEASIAVWRTLGGFDLAGRTEHLADLDDSDDSTVVRTSWPAGGPPRLVLYRITGGGHSEPTRGRPYASWYQRLTGPQNGDIEGVVEIWTFFAAQTP